MFIIHTQITLKRAIDDSDIYSLHFIYQIAVRYFVYRLFCFDKAVLEDFEGVHEHI